MTGEDDIRYLPGIGNRMNKSPLETRKLVANVSSNFQRVSVRLDRAGPYSQIKKYDVVLKIIVGSVRF